MFLKEPIFTGDFLGEVIGEEHFFQDLGKVNVLELLKYLSKFQLPMLSKEAYRQIIKNAEELSETFKKEVKMLRNLSERMEKSLKR